MTKKQKRVLRQIVSAALWFIAAFILTAFVEMHFVFQLLFYLIPYLTVGKSVLLKAFSNIMHGRIFDENFLMCIATVGAFAIGEFPEAVFVMLFYQVGELFQSIAVGRSRKSIASLMEIKPEEATVIRDGTEITVSPEEVEVGEIIIVKPGEKIPLDGTVTEGKSELNCMALTGESEPRYIEEGGVAVSGAINLSGVLKIRALKKYEDSTVAKILELVENASSVKSKTDRFITRFARVYTPVVVILAVLIFALPSVITKNPAEWLGRALIFLVISCPCALVISVPLSYFGGLGSASRRGILIKGACYLEALAEARTVVFDKTGTLTVGKFSVCKVVAEPSTDEKELLFCAYAAEKSSTHPVALAVRDYCRERLIEVGSADSFTELSGMGVKATLDGSVVLAGNERLMKHFGVEVPSAEEGGSIIYIARDGGFIGYFAVSDTVKEDSCAALSELKTLGVKHTAMLTGDRRDNAEKTAAALGIDEVLSELLPGDKVAALESIMKDSETGGKTLYVGDGINDAPVLARADVGIAMGALGSDAAIEAADVVLMDDSPRKIADAIRLARKTRKTVMENIAFAISVKLLFMLLGALGIANLWFAVFADVGVSVIAILNSMRMLKGENS